jgi:hypothetical protein
MDSNVVAFFAIGVSLLVVGLLLTAVVLTVRDTVRKKGRWGINLWPTSCRSCGEPAPAIRRPENLRQSLWGGWTCPQCGLEVDKWGEPVADQPFPAKWSAQLDDRTAPDRAADERYRKPTDDIRSGGESRG